MVSTQFPPRCGSCNKKRELSGGRGGWSAFTAVLTVLLWVLGSPGAQAQNFSCTTTGGNWTTATDWTSCNSTFPNDGQPSASDTYDATVTSGASTLSAAVTVGNVTIDAGTDWLASAPGDTLTLNDALTNSGLIEIDASSGGQGGTTVDIGTNLNNAGTLDVGVSNLSAPTTITATGTLSNAGGIINLQGNATSGTIEQTTLNLEGATPTTVVGQINLSGDALYEVASGITAIGSGGQLSLNGAQARVSIGAGTTNSALTGLASNAGNFIMQGDTGLGAGGATVTTTTGFTNTGNVYIDYLSGEEGASTFNIGGTLTNSGTLDVGVSNLSAPTNVNVTGTLANAGGIINLQGNATSGTAEQTTLNLEGATPTTVVGQINLSGDALYEVASGITAIGSGGQLSLNGAQARVSIGAGTTNSALTGLASNAGNFIMQGDTGLGAGGATVTTTTGFTNTGNVYIDYLSGEEGASTFNIGGTLTNSGTLDAGVSNLSAPTNVNVTGTLANAGGIINLQGNATSGTAEQTTLNLEGATPTTVVGQINLSGDALYEVASGITAIGSGGQLSLNGAQARVSIGAGTTNSALTGLASNAGNFIMQGDTGLGAGGATVTTTTGFTNTGNVYIDYLSGEEGASTFNIGGTLTNSGTLDVGVSNLSAPTNVNVTGTLANAGGIINLQGNATSGTAEQTTLNLEGATPTTVVGQINLSGDALYEVASGITAIGSGGQLSLNGVQARVSIGAGTTNSALTGLASNAGNFIMQGDTGLGAGGATVTTTTGFTNTGNVYIDYLSGEEGASTFNIGGTLTNSGTLDAGVSNLSAPTNISANGLTNSGTINLAGSSITNTTNLTVSGAAGNAGSTNIGAFSDLTVTGAGNAYAQTGGTTSLYANGTLTAPNVNVTGGTLQGNGTVAGNINVSSAGTVEAINPSNGAPATLTINGNYNQSGGTLAALSQGTSAGQIGTVAVASGHSLNLNGGNLASASGSIAYAAGQIFDNVVTFQPGQLFGTFTELQGLGNGVSANLGGGLTLEALYNNSAGNITLEVVSTPATTGFTWTDGTANWNTAGDWSGGVVPTPVANVTIGSGAGGTVTLSQDSTITSLTIGAGTSTGYTLQVNSGNTLTVASSPTSVTVNNSGTIALGGSLNTLGTVTVNSGGALDLSGGTVIDATLAGTGTMQTISGSSGTLHAVTISSGSTYVASNNATTNLFGTITNNGTIQFNGGGGANGFLNLTGAVILAGSGTVAMTDNSGAGNAFFEGNGQTLTNAGNTILGTGIIGNGSLAVVNNATIDATPAGGTSALVLNGSGGITNTNLLEATGTGTLQVNTTVNNAGGNITANNGTVQVDNATVKGGTLNTLNSGTMETIGTSTLDGSTASGAVTISSGSTYMASNNATTDINGSIVNKGTIQLNGGGGANGQLESRRQCDLERRRHREHERRHRRWRRLLRRQWHDPNQCRQHDPGYWDHRQRQPRHRQRRDDRRQQLGRQGRFGAEWFGWGDQRQRRYRRVARSEQWRRIADQRHHHQQRRRQYHGRRRNQRGRRRERHDQWRHLEQHRRRRHGNRSQQHRHPERGDDFVGQHLHREQQRDDRHQRNTRRHRDHPVERRRRQQRISEPLRSRDAKRRRHRESERCHRRW